MYIDRQTDTQSQQIIYQTINQCSICSEIYPLNVKLNVLLSTTSNFLVCFPHNTFYVHNALFGDAANKERTEGSVSSTAHCSSLSTEQHPCPVWTAEQQNREKDLKLLSYLINDWWRVCWNIPSHNEFKLGWKTWEGRNYDWAQCLPILCVCVFIHKLTSGRALFLGHRHSSMCQLMQLSARRVFTSRITNWREVLQLKGKIKTSSACLNYMTCCWKMQDAPK